MNEIAKYPAPHALASQYARAGGRIDGEFAAALSRYEAALTALCFAQLPEAVRAMAANPGDPRAVAELRAVVNGAAGFMQAAIAEQPKAGLP